MKLFVWDLHGVLEEGNTGAVVAVTNNVLAQSGFKERLTEEDCRRLYGKKWFEYFKHLLPGETHETHIELQESSFTYSDKNFAMVASYLKPTRDSHSVLETIQRANHTQLLISNTKPTSLELYMDTLEIRRFFPEGYAFAASTHHPNAAHSKEDVLEEFLDGKELDEIVIIGDSPSDMDLAKVRGGTTYLYSHPWLPFRDCDSDYRIHNLKDVLDRV